MLVSFNSFNMPHCFLVVGYMNFFLIWLKNFIGKHAHTPHSCITSNFEIMFSFDIKIAIKVNIMDMIRKCFFLHQISYTINLRNKEHVMILVRLSIFFFLNCASWSLWRCVRCTQKNTSWNRLPSFTVRWFLKHFFTFPVLFLDIKLWFL